MRGRIVLVPFPFDDLSGIKVRPALCLTYPIGGYQHVIAAFITSAVPSTFAASDLVLDPADADFGRTGLRVRSVVFTHRLMTVSTSVILRNLGRLSDDKLVQVDERLRAVFGL
jgi:mRNA interferase MazF